MLTTQKTQFYWSTMEITLKTRFWAFVKINYTCSQFGLKFKQVLGIYTRIHALGDPILRSKKRRRSDSLPSRFPNNPLGVPANTLMGHHESLPDIVFSYHAIDRGIH